MKKEDCKNEKNRRKKNDAIYMLGSVGLTVAAFFVIPRVIEWGTDKLSFNNQSQISDDDWGPEIVRKTSTKEGEEK